MDFPIVSLIDDERAEQWLLDQMLYRTLKQKQTRCFKTQVKKGEPHKDSKDPPRRRGNKRKGHGTYENDRPPVVGTLGRESGLVRLRVEHRTDGETLSAHVHQLTCPTATVYTDGWRGYNGIARSHMLLSVLVMANGQEMVMVMVFAKSTSTRLKASGQRCTTFYAHFAVFIRSSFRDILLSVNLLLISKLLLLILYQNLFNALKLDMSQVFC